MRPPIGIMSSECSSVLIREHRFSAALEIKGCNINQYKLLTDLPYFASMNLKMSYLIYAIFVFRIEILCYF